VNEQGNDLLGMSRTSQHGVTPGKKQHSGPCQIYARTVTDWAELQKHKLTVSGGIKTNEAIWSQKIFSAKKLN